MDLIIFVVALSILVLVHEFGHYLMAVWNGIKVEEFGLGLPPRIFGKKIGETVFSLNALPIGGFCKLYGEDGDQEGKRAFNNKKPWQKFLVVIGGVLMNVVLAVTVFSVVYGVLGIPTETKEVKVTGVAKNSPAEKSGLKTGDVIYKVENVFVTTPNQLTDEVGKYKGKNVNLLIKDAGNGRDRSVQVEVRQKPPEGEGSMGVAISNIIMVKPKWYEFYKSIGAGFKEAYFWGKIIFGGVTSMVGSLFQGQVPQDVAGPVGMFKATSSIKETQGMWALIHFFAIISVNLAVVNILPFPALDGGRIIFVVYEWITKKRANEKFEIAVNNFGMLVLLSLIVIITVSDVMKLGK